MRSRIIRITLKPFMTGPLPYRNQSIDLRNKSMDWFLYGNGLHHERVNVFFSLAARVFSMKIVILVISAALESSINFLNNNNL